MARYGTAPFWLVAGAMHFVIPRQYEAIVPPYAGALEAGARRGQRHRGDGGGLAVLPERTRRGARWWLLATLVAVYPANIHMALNPEQFPKIPAAALWARLPVQGLFALDDLARHPLITPSRGQTPAGIRRRAQNPPISGRPRHRPGHRAHGLRRRAVARGRSLPRSTAA